MITRAWHESEAKRNTRSCGRDMAVQRVKAGKRSIRARLLIALGLCLAAFGLWLAFTDHPRVWPVRNTLQYHLVERLDSLAPRSPGAAVTLRGTVQTVDGEPIPHARVLLAG